jgi:cbb3-type cytochrome oxidase maturation protein
MMVPLAVLLGLSFLLGFVYCARRGQFDDLETPAFRALLDDSERKMK